MLLRGTLTAWRVGDPMAFSKGRVLHGGRTALRREGVEGVGGSSAEKVGTDLEE